MIKSEHTAIIKLMLHYMPVSAGATRPGTGPRPCVWETRSVFRCFRKLCSAAVWRARTPRWQQQWLAGLFWKNAAYWPGLSVFLILRGWIFSHLPLAASHAFPHSVRSSPQAGGGEKSRGSVFIKARSPEGAEGSSETGRERDAERQTGDLPETGRKAGRETVWGLS